MILWTSRLQSTLSGTNILALSLDPGDVDTFSDRLKGPTAAADAAHMKATFKKPEEGAHPSVFCAAAKIVREEEKVWKGSYVEPERDELIVGDCASELASNQKIAKELWETTVKWERSVGLE